jgi:hypothetical protein
MSVCPVPHTKREQFWFAAGIAAGGILVRVIYRRCFRAAAVVADVPERVFKLATSEELARFKATGKIESELDENDGFVHLSDRTSPPNVAKLFFSGAKDLHLIELRASSLAGPVQWIVGPIGTSPNSSSLSSGAATTVHFDHSCGCVHVYGESVSTAGIVRSELLKLDAAGVHKMPAWL